MLANGSYRNHISHPQYCLEAATIQNQFPIPLQDTSVSECIQAGGQARLTTCQGPRMTLRTWYSLFRLKDTASGMIVERKWGYAGIFLLSPSNLGVGAARAAASQGCTDLWS
jgi:hypothetical protein